MLNYIHHMSQPVIAKIPKHPPLDAFCSDCPPHWPLGRLPRLKPRQRDPDAPPPPVRPGEGHTCRHEALLDGLTVAQADRIAEVASASAKLVAGFLPAMSRMDNVDDNDLPVRGQRLGGSPTATAVVRYRDPESGECTTEVVHVPCPSSANPPAVEPVSSLL